MLGGAIGDALGAPVEFWSLSEIRARLGADGVTGFVNGEAAVTDDTQMTIFTAEGLIRASVRARSRGICHAPGVVHRAYLRWLYTQGVPWENNSAAAGANDPDGWLVLEQRLHRRRAPGNTCLSALQSGHAGSIDQPLNHSMGCGGVMRAAPVGLLLAEPDKAFQLGCEVAALTHGHPGCGSLIWPGAPRPLPGGPRSDQESGPGQHATSSVRTRMDHLARRRTSPYEPASLTDSAGCDQRRECDGNYGRLPWSSTSS